MAVSGGQMRRECQGGWQRGPARGGPVHCRGRWRWSCASACPVGAEAASQHAELRSKDEIPVTYNQGIARISEGWILSGTLSPIPNTDVIVRTDEQFNVVVRNEAAIPSEWRARGYVHIGDIDVVGNVVYAPFEQPGRTAGSSGHRSLRREDPEVHGCRPARAARELVRCRRPEDSDRVLHGQLRR